MALEYRSITFVRKGGIGIQIHHLCQKGSHWNVIIRKALECYHFFGAKGRVLKYWSVPSFERFFWVVRGRQLNSQPVSWRTLILFDTSLWCCREVSHLVVGEGRSKSWVFQVTPHCHTVTDWRADSARDCHAVTDWWRTDSARDCHARDWLVESRFHMWLLRSPWLIGWQPILYVTVTPRPGLVENRLAEKTGLLLPSPARHIQFLESVFNCNLNISQQQLTLLPSHEAGVSSNELPAVEACKVASYCP